MEYIFYKKDDTWYSRSEIRTKYHLRHHDLKNLVKNNILETKQIEKLTYFKIKEWPYDFNINEETAIIEKVKSDYKKGYLTNSSKKIGFYLDHNKVIKEYCEEKLRKQPGYATIGKALLAVADESKDLKKCIICGKPIPFRDSGTAYKHATFCSRECAMTDEGKRIQVERYKAANPINPACREDVKAKIRETNLKRYGCENPGANPEIIEKRRQTLIERYGVENYFQIRNTENNVIENSYKKHFNVLKEMMKKSDIDILFDFEKYKNWRENPTDFEFKCNKCGLIFSRSLGTDRSNFCCPHCNRAGCRSVGEHLFFEKIKEIYDGKIVTNRKNIIYPYELDIFIPDKRVAFEFDGLYWHSERHGKDKKYHLYKTDLCKEKGIKLIHVFEDEWEFKSDIVTSRIKHILGLVKNKIYARNCEVREVSYDLSSKFIEKYHLQGNVPSSIRLGLYYKNHLVALMTFGKSRYNKKYDWELLRYCTVANFNVIGGAGKLLSHFRKNYQGSIISYADKRWSDGDLYRQLGFRELEDSKPGYFYIKGINRYSRIQFQRKNLKNVLPKFDENLTEYENMLENGYQRIWDCGNKVFTLEN